MKIKIMSDEVVIRRACQQCNGVGIRFEERAKACATCRGTGWSANIHIPLWAMLGGLGLAGALAIMLALLTMGAAPGVMMGTPSTPLIGGGQVFYGYACPAPYHLTIWLSDPYWRADFIRHLCNWLTWGHE